MPGTNDIRSLFLDYFAKNDHQIMPSAPLTPRNDPTLLFTNAGMVPFKYIFTGQEKRPVPRATSAQKCIRAGGKHNDLDNVGYTARHHTFFEMLGNFSFGDYFKERAIELAWGLITKEMQLPVEKLLVTVFSEDEEAAALWRKIAGLPDEKIIRIPTADNFWRMGDSGPCGPCSEIFYDHGPSVAGGPPGSPGEDGDRFIEFWNLVFMQFEEDGKGNRSPLPRPSIDTGMGLERISAILQGKKDNYDTDILRALIVASAEASKTDPDGPFKKDHRVIADHLRSTAFLIAEGILPSNEGRGYVLRRIIRRAVRHAHHLGVKGPFMAGLLPALIRQMGRAYHELITAESLIAETLTLEETKFHSLLERGLFLLQEECDKLGEGQTLSGDVAFKLYDTYGFPIDLTADALREKHLNVDLAGFEKAMQEQRQRARKAWAGSGDNAAETVWFDLKETHGTTEFLGYTAEKAEATVSALLKIGKDGSLENVTEAAPEDKIIILLNQSPFYGESGGQAGDQGVIRNSESNPEKFSVDISDTQKKNGSLIAHTGTVKSGKIKVGAAVEAEVNHASRTRAKAHHSATHLLHAALKERLGPQVMQKGSFNHKDGLRFDFSYNKPLSRADIMAVEQAVNEQIRQNTEVTTHLMTPEEAVKQGAVALFGEKYGETVRVLAMGLTSEGHKAFSQELCGGTHVRRTGDIGVFRILTESAVSSGVRRIEAVAGRAAMVYTHGQEDLLSAVAALLKTSPETVPGRVSALQEERKKLSERLVALQRKHATAEAEAGKKQIGELTLISGSFEDIAPKELKSLAENLLKKNPEKTVVALVSVSEGKAGLLVALSPDLVPGLNAVDLVKQGVQKLGGTGGGGRPDMAQAGGNDFSDPKAALELIAGILRRQSAA